MTAAADTMADREQAVDTAPEHAIGIGLALFAFVVYWFTGPMNALDSFVPLADAFMHGRLSIPVDRPWFELVPVPGGSGAQYSPFPPVPALTLVPVIALLGLFSSTELSGNVMASIFGALNVALAWYLLAAIGVALRPRLVIVIGFAFTTHWWVAGMGGTHHYAQVVATLFLLVALNLAVRRRWPLLAGLALGLAAGSRLPTGLALPLLLVLYLERWRWSRAAGWLLAGLVVPAALFAWYNLARFGSPFDGGYAHIPSGNAGLLVTDEPWYSRGLISPFYIPRHIYAIFLQSFTIVDTFPFLKPSFTGLSLTLSAPFLFWAVKARGPLVAITWLAVELILLPDLMHGAWGFAQFGYRFILDAVPLLLLLLGWAYRERASWSLVAAVAVGVLVHLYGIVAINVFGFVS